MASDMSDLDRICEKVKERLQTEKGQKELQRIAEEVREEEEKWEKASRVSYEDLIKPFTI